MNKKYDNICRLCLCDDTDTQMEPLFPGQDLLNKLYDGISIQLKYVQDLLPSLICESCKSKLILSFQFKKLCIKSENFLKQTHPQLFDEVCVDDAKLGGLVAKTETDEMIELLEIDESCSESSPEAEKSVATTINHPENRQKITKTFDITHDSCDAHDEPEAGAEDSERLLPKVYSIRPEPQGDTSNRVKVVSHEKSRAKYYSKCDVCLQYFQNVKQHSLTHTREKSHHCTICGKAFAQIGNFNKHLNTHMGNRPHKCTVDLCEKAFADGNSLKYHMIQHTGEKKYHCEFCGKSFGLSHTLSAHRKIHTQDRKFSCVHCPKTFLSRFELKKHTRVHTGEKPFQCDHCPKAFTSSGNLTTHKRIHTKIRPYKCSVCNMNFAYRSVLNNHMSTHASLTDRVKERKSKPELLKKL